MSNNLHTIFSGSECPPHSVLLGYFGQTLTEEEMHRVEQHLTDCEMCCDQLEGLSKMKNPGELDLIVEELAEQIRRKRGRILGMSRNYALMAAAAVLIVIIGSVVVVRMLTHTEVRDHLMTFHMDLAERPGPEAVESPKAPLNSRSLAQSTVPGQPGKEQNASGRSQLHVSVVQDDQEQMSSTDVAAGDTIESFEMISAEEAVTAGGVAVVIQADSLASNTVISEYRAPSAFQAEAKKVGAEKDAGQGMPDSKGASVMGIAMEEFEAGHYNHAATIFEQVTASQPDNCKAAYYLAYCYFKEKQYKKALATLASILKDKGNDFYKEASALSDTITAMKDR